MLDLDVDLDGAMALAREPARIRHESLPDRSIVPQVHRTLQFLVARYGSAELDAFAVDIAASVQIVVTHPLRKILQMTLVRLEDGVHDGAMAQEIGEPSHVRRAEQVDLEVVLESDIEAVEGGALDQGDASDIGSFLVVDILAIADREGVVDGEMETVDVSIN